MTDSARRAPVVNNYLATAPDLTEAKNKAIDDDIADFSQFIEDTIAIEKQRLENQDSRIKSLVSLTQSGIEIGQKLQARNEQAAELGDIMDDKRRIEGLIGEENELDDDRRFTRGAEKILGAQAGNDANTATNTDDKYDARQVQYESIAGTQAYNSNLKAKQNLKNYGQRSQSVYEALTNNTNLDVVGNRTIKEFTDIDDAKEYLRLIRGVYLRGVLYSADNNGVSFSDRQFAKHLAPEIKKAEDFILKQWDTDRIARVKAVSKATDQEELITSFAGATTVDDVLGKTGIIATKKAEFEAMGMKNASFAAVVEFYNDVEPLIKEGLITPPQVQDLINGAFTPLGSEKETSLKDTNVPAFKFLKGKLQGAAAEYASKSNDQREDQLALDIETERTTGFAEFMEGVGSRPTIEQLNDYKLTFFKKFPTIVEEEQLPEWLKNVQTANFLSDKNIEFELESRRIKNLPITEDMVNKIVDPDLRKTYEGYVNTPEIGAFTADEATDVDERIVAIVKEAKQLRDLNQAKTDKYLVARDNAKRYYTARFKELVVGGQSRETAFYNAKIETIDKVRRGIFDTDTILPISVQATKDLQTTLNAISKYPALIYSSEEWAGEKPHLDKAREYIRTGGRSDYPSYYLRFNFIKNSDGAYLTPEEIFEARVEKVDGSPATKKLELPERKELKNNIGDQNKLLNKPNSTKTLQVMSKPGNQEWMTSTVPDTSAINAQAIIDRARQNIRGQHFMGGINVDYKKQTTISEENNAKLLEAVPELKETPFLHFNNLSPAAAKALLMMTPIK